MAPQTEVGSPMNKALMSFALLLAALTPLAAAPAGNGPYTVGDLVLRLAPELGLRLEEPSAALARTALSSVGIRIEAELDSPLVERDAVAIFNQLELHLTTSQPARPVGTTKVEMLIALLRDPDSSPDAAEVMAEVPPEAGDRN